MTGQGVAGKVGSDMMIGEAIVLFGIVEVIAVVVVVVESVGVKVVAAVVAVVVEEEPLEADKAAEEH